MSFDRRGCTSSKLIYLVRFRFLQQPKKKQNQISYHFVASIEFGFSSIFSRFFSVVSDCRNLCVFCSSFFVYGWLLYQQCFVVYHQELVILSQFIYDVCPVTNLEVLLFLLCFGYWNMYKIPTTNGRLSPILCIFLFLKFSLRFFFFFPFWRVFVSVLVSRFSCRLNSYFVSLHFPIMCIFCLVAGSWKSPPSKCTHNKSKTSSSVHIDICMCVCLCVCDILLSAMQCVHSTQPLVISAMSILHASLNLVAA